MTRIARKDDGFVVEAGMLAEAFGIDAATVQPLMKSGAITSLCEKGAEADEGRWRLTFYHAGRALRLTLGADRQVIGRARFDAPRGGAKAGR